MVVSRCPRGHGAPPERTLSSALSDESRTQILHGSRAMLQGDWRKCMQNLRKVKFLSEIVDISALEQRIKEEALHCYCLKFSQSYDSLDLDQMTQMYYHRLQLSRLFAQSELSRLSNSNGTLCTQTPTLREYTLLCALGPLWSTHYL